MNFTWSWTFFEAVPFGENHVAGHLYQSELGVDGPPTIHLRIYNENLNRLRSESDSHHKRVFLLRNLNRMISKDFDLRLNVSNKRASERLFSHEAAELLSRRFQLDTFESVILHEFVKENVEMFISRFLKRFTLEDCNVYTPYEVKQELLSWQPDFSSKQIDINRKINDNINIENRQGIS